MENMGNSPEESEGNAIAAQAECLVSTGPLGITLHESYLSVPNLERYRRFNPGGILDTEELGEWHKSEESEEIQVAQSSDVTMHPAHVSALIKALVAMFGHVPTLHCLLNLVHGAMKGKRIIEWNKCPESSALWKPNTLCGIVLKEPNSQAFDVGVLHSGENVTISWHKLRLGKREPVNTMCSGDGGLVCFCLTDVEDEGDGLRLVLSVVNPLTQECRVLPSYHGVSPFNLRMMQLVMDKSTKQYQVLLVHDEKDPSAASSRASHHIKMSEDEPGSEGFVEVSLEMQWFPETLGGVIFDSGTGVWRNARSSSQVFLGPAIHDNRYMRGPGLGWRRAWNLATESCVLDYQGISGFFGPVAYDCATGKVIIPGDPYDGIAPHQFALRKNRLFKLYQRLGEYQIRVEKDHLGIQALVKDDHLTPEAHAKLKPSYSRSGIVACEGYLLVRASPFEEIFQQRHSYHGVGLLYDMRVRRWVDFRERTLNPRVASVDELIEVLEESPDGLEEVKAYGVYPRYFDFAPFMLCNLDWEAVP